MNSHKFLEHTADLKFLAEGNSLEEAFIESTKALKEAICGEIKILAQQTREINVKSDNLENLLYDFLEEFLVLLESEDFILSEIKEIKIDQKKFTLSAQVSGDKIDNYKFTNDVKAITYNEMFIKNENNKWRIQVVLDV
jgi:SHS2 domain-containing protein